jgi:hypothetical protein
MSTFIFKFPEKLENLEIPSDEGLFRVASKLEPQVMSEQKVVDKLLGT